MTASLHSQWIEFSAQSGQSLWASSSLSETLGGELHTYGPEFLFDSDLATSWVEGASDEGIGEELIILTDKAIKRVSLNNGFSRSASLYAKNNRLKKIDLSLLIGFTAPGMVSENDYYLYFLKEHAISSDLYVEDRPDTQSFDISLSTEEQLGLYREILQSFSSENPFFLKMMLEETGLSKEEYLSDMNLMLMIELYGFYALQITIKDVYKGSRYNDSCLSEISLQLEDF
jgi:hypothetical protein